MVCFTLFLNAESLRNSMENKLAILSNLNIVELALICSSTQTFSGKCNNYVELAIAIGILKRVLGGGGEGF